MCQPVVYKRATRKGEDLGFVLEASEGRRKEQTVKIPLKTGHYLLFKFFSPNPIYGENFLPARIVGHANDYIKINNICLILLMHAKLKKSCIFVRGLIR